MFIFGLIFAVLLALLRPRSHLVLENLALRQQLAVLTRSAARPKLRGRDRLFWVLLSHLWGSWRPNLLLVKPETVIKWHRDAFQRFWKRKSRAAMGGRPRLGREVIALIKRMCRENPTWSATRFKSELALLGFDVGDTTVANYMLGRGNGPSSQGWCTFLKNHMPKTVACDFFVVPTATFRLLYCFLVLSHDRRRMVHFNVTANPSAEWTAQQIVEAFPGDDAIPKFLVRDRDGIYGAYFRKRVQNMGIREIITSRKSPWQNPYVERAIGSIRRECLNHLMVLGEAHLRRIVKMYVAYYNEARPHLSLE